MRVLALELPAIKALEGGETRRRCRPWGYPDDICWRKIP